MIGVLTPVPLEGAMQGDRLRVQSVVEGARRAASSVEVVDLQPKTKTPWLSVASSLAHGEAPYMAWYQWHWQPVECADTPDIVIGVQLRAAQPALECPARYRILDLTDSLGLYRHNLGTISESRRKRWMLRGIEGAEIRWSKRFDEVWVSTIRDQQWLALMGLSTRVIENAVPQKKILTPGNLRHLLFVANLEYLPNRVGLNRFLKSVWPTLYRHDYQLTVVGKGSEHLQEPGVTGMGYVPSVEPYYVEAGIVISPVPVGAGSQNKILEAMGYGRPVVVAAEALQGLTPQQRAAAIPVTGTSDWLPNLESLPDTSRYQRVVTDGFQAVPVAGDAVAARLFRLLHQ